MVIKEQIHLRSSKTSTINSNKGIMFGQTLFLSHICSILYYVMNILFISDECIAGNLAILLKKEGHNVKLHIKNKNDCQNFDNLVEKISSWKKELKWVGKDGLIVFGDVGFGKVQDSLRKKGYKVFGGCEEADKLEKNREFGQQIFKKYGLKLVNSKYKYSFNTWSFFCS